MPILQNFGASEAAGYGVMTLIQGASSSYKSAVKSTPGFKD